MKTTGASSGIARLSRRSHRQLYPNRPPAALREGARALRRALLSRCDPVHHLRYRGGVSVPVGGRARRYRGLRLLVDDGLSRGANSWIYLRMDERGARMGVKETALRPA